MDRLLKDIRYAIRSLFRRPGFTAIAVITLALGIGANTAIFSVVNALLLKPLPYRNPDQLFWIGEVSPQVKDDLIPGAHFLEWSEQSQTLEQIAVYNAHNLTLTGAGEPERLQCGQVSTGFFTMLGVQPRVGRDFLPAEDRPGGDRVAIIGHGLWQRRFNADRNIIGQSITLDDQSYTVVGVLPPDFRFFQPFELWVVLLGAVSLILLIACVNVANLLLSHAVIRQKEFAIRAGLGAGRLRLMQQMLTESLLLALGGGLLGLLLAFWLKEALVALAATNTLGEVARLANVNIDLRVLGFTLLASFLTGTLFGLVPAFQLSRPNLNNLLKQGWRGSGFHRSRLRHVLMMTEVALAIVLLVAAGLLIRSFVNLLAVNPGYTSKNLLTMRVSLPLPRYEQKGQREAFYLEVLQRVSSLPGVDAAGAINHLPLTSFAFGGWLRVPGGPQTQTQERTATPIGVISPDYFRAMGIPLLDGRAFTERDNSESPRVVILSEALARELFPNEGSIGKQVWVPGASRDTPTVIGVVGDVRHQGLDQDATPQVYVPYPQQAPASMTMVIRTTTDPLALAASVRNQVLAVDRSLPVYEVRTMEQRLASSISSRRFNLLLLGAFALLALVLAAVGVYGVIAYLVTQRAHEIGIRMALGAQRSDVLRLLIGQGMASVVIGVLIGLAAAWALTRLMTSLLFGVTPTDTATFVAVSAVLIAVALLACYLPARRATKVDPLVALRYE
jgi:putative ABC transport system permease protein